LSAKAGLTWFLITLASSPLLTGTVSPVWIRLGPQLPDAAASTAELVSGAFTLPFGSSPTQAAVLAPICDASLLLVNWMVVPQPEEVAPVPPLLKEQALTATGKTQDVGGGDAGGGAHAIASAETVRLSRPRSRRSDVGTCVAVRQSTALT
jgi:hypothetical protein